MNVEIGLWLFMVYSVLGWVLETVFCAIKHGKFVNRGFLNGPVCGIYGVAMLLMSVFLQDLQGNWLFMFIGCMVTSSVVELLGGMALEHFGAGRWWDYSDKDLNKPEFYIERAFDRNQWRKDKTINALKEFQKESGLVVDGICGQKTREKLKGG